MNLTWVRFYGLMLVLHFHCLWISTIHPYLLQVSLALLLLSLFSHSVVSNFCHPMDCSTPGFPVLHHPHEFAQNHVHWVSDAIQPSHSLSSPSSAINLSQLQGLFQWVGSSHQVAKVLELQPQHQSFQWGVKYFKNSSLIIFYKWWSG